MKISLKAALFSAFVFPGSGHLLLKKYVHGAVLTSITVLCVWALASTALEMAQEISLKIQSGEIPLDVTRITDEVSKQASTGDTWLADNATYILLICWLVGIIDSYRLGRLQDNIDSARDTES